MIVSIIGTNGFLSGRIGQYCNKKGYELKAYGLEEPKSHAYAEFKKVDLLNNSLDFDVFLKKKKKELLEKNLENQTV